MVKLAVKKQGPYLFLLQASFKLSKSMASTLVLQFLSSSTNLNVAVPRTYSFNVQNNRRTMKCSSIPEPKDQFLDLTPAPESINTTSAEKFPIEKRRRSEIIRDRKQRGIEKPEPPNFEIGWKRTKEINLEKPKGYVIMDFLEKFEGLMAREFGSKELLAKTGEIVAERAREEAEVLRDEGKVEERMVTELFRVLKLMEMDLAMVKASVKEETLSERIEQARARCRQAILVANSF
ncbi:unnamed protein product [Thlaspi arvense]|uniref:Chlororespiratory reduction 41 n=1 Tax=Thlaspi arvense TaxID=13288 RepID=A0AAU9R8S8_THLAR|nr:unnamed protein product [Thlaspi arvense]